MAVNDIVKSQWTFMYPVTAGIRALYVQDAQPVVTVNSKSSFPLVHMLELMLVTLCTRVSLPQPHTADHQRGDISLFFSLSLLISSMLFPPTTAPPRCPLCLIRDV